MAMLFCCYGFASTVNAGRHSFSVRIVIGDSAIAAWTVAAELASSRGAVRIVGINRVLKDGSITATGSVSTDGAERRDA
jgi:hypothetical protein